MSEDVAALRVALAKATPGPWRAGVDWAAIGSGPDSVVHGYMDTTCDSCGERMTGDAAVALSAEDAELIVLLRNNAEALLDALANERTKIERVARAAEVYASAGLHSVASDFRAAIGFENRTTGAAEAQQTAGGAEKSQEVTTTDDR